MDKIDFNNIPNTQQPIVSKNTQTPAVPSMVIKPKKKNVLPIVIVSVLALILLSGGIVLAAKIWDPPWNPFRPSPESVIQKAWNNLKSVKSETFNAEVSLKSDKIEANGSGGSLDLSFKANGGVDYSDPENSLSDVQGSVRVSLTDITNPTTDYKFSLAGESRLIKKDFYLKLDEIDLGGLEGFLMMFFGVDTSKIKGQWIRFQADAIAQQEMPQYSAMTSEEKKNAEKEAQDTIDKIVKVLLDKKVYDIDQLEDNQGLEGKEYHYYISLNQKKIIEASPELFNILKEYYSNLNPGVELPPDFTLEEFQKGINKMFDMVGKVGIDLFIGKNDGYFRKFQIIKDFDLSKFDEAYKGNISLIYKIEQTGINKPVQVVAPEQYKDFQDILSEMFSAGADSFIKPKTTPGSKLKSAQEQPNLLPASLLQGVFNILK